MILTFRVRDQSPVDNPESRDQSPKLRDQSPVDKSRAVGKLNDEVAPNRKLPQGFLHYVARAGFGAAQTSPKIRTLVAPRLLPPHSRRNYVFT